MLKMFCEISRAKNLPCLKADILMLIIMIAVALMAGGLYAYKKYTGFIQSLGAAVCSIIFMGLFLCFVGWLLNKAVKEDSKEFQAGDDES